jgi:hypothetical protein
LVSKLFTNQIKHTEQVYPFTGDTLIGYTVHGVKVERHFRKSGAEVVRGTDDTELKGKERNGQLKKLNAAFTGRNGTTTPKEG